MRYIHYILMLCAIVALTACEELIDVNLNDSDPKIVIVADLHNGAGAQEIRVSRTVNFDAEQNYAPVENARVYVRTGPGQLYGFNQQEGGQYVNAQIPMEVGQSYTLEVHVDDQQFTSRSVMLPYIEIDSLGLTKENIFDETYYFVNLKFQDPEGQSDYYRYTVSLNGGPFVFSTAMSDKFNDGNQVTHQIGAPDDTELKPGDDLRIRRAIVNKDVYRYWSEYQSTNPGSAAPGNPTSNISNGALGYFSVSHIKEYAVTVEELEEESDLE